MNLSHSARRILLGMVVASCLLPANAAPVPKKIEHPFLWWTKEEAAAIRERLETDPEAKKQLAATRFSTSQGSGKAAPLWDLFQIAIYDDAGAKSRQLAELRKFIGAQPETDAGGRWVVGNASATDRHMREEQSMNVLRYDLLYDELTDEEKVGIEDAMRVYIEFQLSGHRPIHPHFGYGRTDTLPNMHWPRGVGTHLMAVALQDEKIIKDVWEGYGGWFWFFDQYLADGLYMEEFAKYYSNIGTMMLVCEGLERLGLGDKYGYGYVSKSGATVRDFLFQPTRLSYPPTFIPGGMPNIRIVGMGDTPPKGNLHGIQGHGFVAGYKPGQRKRDGGNFYFSGSRMNGPFPKMQAPLWCEIGHRRFPDAGFDYFIAAMRAPEEKKGYPTLFFGLEPIDPAKAKPPVPKSVVSEQRGFAMLKADESTSYWTSGKPAVTMQFSMYYVHYAHDCFSLLGYHAKGRPLYNRGWGVRSDHPKNESIRTGGKGYIGGHAWFDTPRGQAAGLTVDNLKPRPVDSGQNGCVNQRIRHQLSDDIKFTAVAAKGLFPGVWQERAIFLTDHYLVDIYANRSDRKRRYDWGANGAGTLAMDGWTPTTELYGSMLYRDMGDLQPAGTTQPEGNDPTNVHKFEPSDKAWSTHIVQDYTGRDVSTSVLGKPWYDRKVGVRITALGAPGTVVYGGRPPVDGGVTETGGAWLNIRRETDNTNFIVVHEPFDKGQVPTTKIEKIVDRDDVVGLRVTGNGFDDLILMATGEDVSMPRSVSALGYTHTFTGHLVVRMGQKKETVEFRGPGEVKLPVPDTTPSDPYEALVYQLKHPNTRTRESASIKLARMGDEAAAAIPVILEGLTEKVTIGNKVAAETVSWMGPIALPEIKKHLTHPDPFVRAELLYGLQSFDGDASSLLPEIIQCLADENRYVRRNATKMIIKLGPKAEAAIPALSALMNDYVNARYAGYALAAIGEAAIPVAEAMLQDPASQTRGLRLLTAMGPVAAPSAPMVATLIDDPATRTDALKALGAMGTAANAQGLSVAKVIATGEGDYVSQAAETLVAMKPLPQGMDPIPSLLAGLKNPEGVYRMNVIRALAKFPGPQTTKAVIEIVKPGSFKVDGKNSYGQVMTMALEAAGNDPEVQKAMASMFEVSNKGKRKGQLSKGRYIASVVTHPNFPAEMYKAELTAALNDKFVGLPVAAVLLSIDPSHAAAKKKFESALTATVDSNPKRQKQNRAKAWKVLPVASRGGWSIDWGSMLQSDDVQLRAFAIAALGDFPAEFKAQETNMLALLDAPEPEIAKAAAELLASGKGPASDKALEVYIEQARQAKDWRVQAPMVGKLAELGRGHEELAIPALKAFAKHEDFFVRKAAEGALYALEN